MVIDGRAEQPEQAANVQTAWSRPARAARQHPIVAVFVVALGARMVLAIVFTAAGLNSRIAPDSDLYLQLAERMAGLRGGRALHHETFFRTRFATYLYPVSALFRVFGAHPILAQLVTGVFAAIAAAATTRLATEILPVTWALGIGLVVALYPSMVLWSAVPLRDSAVWACAACLAVAVMWISRARSAGHFALLAAIIAVLLYLLGHLRVQALCVACIALVLQAILGPMRYRLATMATAIGLAVVIPMLMGFGLGPAGINFITGQDLGAERIGNAIDAESAFVSGRVGDLAHIPDGLKVIVLEPLPWTSLRGSTVDIARVESPLWWALVVATMTGLPLLWRSRRVLGYPTLYAAGVLVVLVLAEGNFGTAYRHRSELVWPMALVAGVGLHNLVTRRAQRPRTSIAR